MALQQPFSSCTTHLVDRTDRHTYTPLASGTYERVQNYSPYRKGRVRGTKPEIVALGTPFIGPSLTFTIEGTVLAP